MNSKYNALPVACVPGTAFGAKNKLVNKTTMCSTFKELIFYLSPIFINLYSKTH